MLAPTDTLITNRNRINVNSGDFLNSNRVTLATGRLNMENDNLKLIDMTYGKGSVGEKGVDALTFQSLNL